MAINSSSPVAGAAALSKAASGTDAKGKLPAFGPGTPVYPPDRLPRQPRSGSTAQASPTPAAANPGVATAQAGTSPAGAAATAASPCTDPRARARDEQSLPHAESRGSCRGCCQANRCRASRASPTQGGSASAAGRCGDSAGTAGAPDRHCVRGACPRLRGCGQQYRASGHGRGVARGARGPCAIRHRPARERSGAPGGTWPGAPGICEPR